MRYAPLVVAVLVATALPTLATAQRVSADIIIGSGPVAGRIIVGDPVGSHSRRVVVVDPRDHERPQYREVEVSRMHRGYGWWRNQGYRAVTVWYDADRDRYYDYGDQYRDGLREVVIYVRDGRYYGDQYDQRGDRGYDRRTHGRDNGYRNHDDRYQNRDRDAGYRNRDDDHDNRDRD
jgi:hypothetical protein